MFLVFGCSLEFGFGLLLVGLNLYELVSTLLILDSFVGVFNPMGETELGLVLNRICRSNRWSYGVFWSFDRRNSM